MIPIRNVYYMLAYAFQALKSRGWKSIEAETFNNAADLCAEILIQGVSTLLKRGLGREYRLETEALSSVRGRIDIAESLKTQSVLRKKLVCTYDVFTVNSQMNKIVKTTMEHLLGAHIAKERKWKLKKLLLCLNEIESIDLYSVDWHMRYDRNNQTYRMLIGICELVVKGLLQTNSTGKHRLMEFFDEQQMSRLYERFILEYYRRHYPELSPRASHVPWAADDGVTDLLPAMRSDVTLMCGSRILIIDAKYYAHTMQTYYDARTIHSGNLYQIFTYVKNKTAEMRDAPVKVSGLLLYAGTDETQQPDKKYRLSGNLIGVRTLNLNCDFEGVAKQLDFIVKEFMDINGQNLSA